MADELKVGIVAAVCVVGVALAVSALHGPVWYAVGPLIVYAAYLIKLKIRRLRDDPRLVSGVLVVVSIAMVAFAGL